MSITGSSSAEEFPESKLYRNRNFTRIFSAGLFSVSGYSLTSLILLWEVFNITHSSIYVALLGISETVGGVSFSLPAGTIVDRYKRKTLMILSDLIRCALIGTLSLMLLFLGYSFPAIAGIVFIVSGITTVFQPAERSLLPVIVPENSLSTANGMVGASRSIMQFTANSAAGIIIAFFGPAIGLLINVGTYLASAILIMSVRVREPVSDRTSQTVKYGFLNETRMGMRWLLKNRGLFHLTVSAMFLNFFFTLVYTFIVFYTSNILHGGPITFGIMLGVIVIGEGAGSLIVGRTGALKYTGLVWTVFYGVNVGMSVVLLALFKSYILSFPLFFFAGFFGGFAGNTWLSSVQIIVPRDMQGRYFGIDSLGSWAILPLAQAAGGIMIAEIGVVETYLISGILMLLTGLLFLLSGSLRKLRAIV